MERRTHGGVRQAFIPDPGTSACLSYLMYASGAPPESILKQNVLPKKQHARKIHTEVRELCPIDVSADTLLA